MKQLISWLLLVQLPGLLLAQSPRDSVQIASLTEAWQYAASHNLQKNILALQTEQAARDLKTAKGNRLPSISGAFSGQHNISLPTTPLPGELFGKPGQTISAQFGQKNSYNTGVSISKDLLDRQQALQTKTAHKHLEINYLQTHSFEQSLEQQIAYHYYTYQIGLQALQAHQRSAQVADSLLLFTQEKFDAGLVDAMALRQAQINQQQVRQHIYHDQLLLSRSQHELQLLLGVDTGQALALRPQALQTDPGAFDMELGANPELMVSEKQVEVAQLGVRTQQAAQLPKLQLSSYWGLQQFQEDLQLSFKQDSWTPYKYIALNVQIPIFSGLSARNRLKNAKTELEISKQTHADNQRTSQLRDKMLLDEHLSYLHIAQSAQTNERLLLEKLTLSEQKLRTGLISTHAHLSAFEDYLDGYQAYLNALANLYGNYAKIITRK